MPDDPAAPWSGARRPAWPRWLALALLASAAARAEVRLPAIFSAHAVLQRAAEVPVWGRADPAERVIVRYGGRIATTTAGPDGRWRVTLDLAAAGDEAAELTVEGRNRIVVPDVIVGEVWLCAGQSNMEWMLAATLGVEEEYRRPAEPRLRQFFVRRTGPAKPAEECDGRWVVAAPDTIGRFSAVAYHFGRELVSATGRAVGLLAVGAGGTPIEGWMGAEALARDPAWQADRPAAERAAREYPARLRAYEEGVADWLVKYRRHDRAVDAARFAAPDVDDRAWRAQAVPEGFDQPGLPASGAIWLRRRVRVPEVEAIGLERGFQLSLGVIRGADAVYWNGHRLGETPLSNPGAHRLRRYVVPPALLQRGAEAVLAIRVFYPQGGVRITVPADPPLIANTVPLDGEWRVATEFAFEDPPPAEPLPSPPARPGGAGSGQYNGLIAPLIPYALRGAIWYQGESNAGRAADYRASFELMLADWRARWGRGDFPCYFAQLANYNAKRPAPGESTWAELREAQTRSLDLPQTGQAVTIDLGEELEIHPRNKRDVGARLARLARARTYGRPVVDSGPVFRAASVERGAIRIRFDAVHGGLVAGPLPPRYAPTTTRPERTRPLVRHAPAGALEGFAICGEDRRWVWAGAVIEGDTVVVSASEVPRPVAVRYAWADNPTCNLYNGAGLPAGPFRTDSFPLTTARASLPSP